MSTSKELLIEHTVPGGEAPSVGIGTKRANSNSMILREINSIPEDAVEAELRRKRNRNNMRRYRAKLAILAKKGIKIEEKPKEAAKRAPEAFVRVCIQAAGLDA